MQQTWFDTLEEPTCVEGNLFDVPVDAVVVPVNVALNLNYTLGRELARRGGAALAGRLAQRAASLSDGRLDLGSATSMDTADLDGLAERVILVAWWNEDTAYDDNHLYRCYASALREAFAHGSESLALPMLGGGGGVSSDRRARVLCDLLRQFDRLKGSQHFSVRAIVFVDRGTQNLDAVQQEMDRRLFAP